jgi:hypothetical protein
MSLFFVGFEAQGHKKRPQMTAAFFLEILKDYFTIIFLVTWLSPAFTV